MVDVLLAVFNGEKYLREQLYSVLAQDFRDFRIVARDDGSSDGSLKILEEFETLFPQKVKILRTETQKHSASDNFFELIRNSDAEYMMLCDQDDFWDYNKITLTMEQMKQYPSDMPLLIHTDLAVADESLALINSSFNAMMQLDAENITLEKLLSYNCVTGCTVMINRALADIAVPAVTDGIVMHDWWLGLCAITFGKLVYLDATTMLYRQHGNNAVGAKKKTLLSATLKADALHDCLTASYAQAKKLSRDYKGKIPPEKEKIIRGYAIMPRLNKFERAVNILRYGYTKSTAIKTAGQIILS